MCSPAENSAGAVGRSRGKEDLSREALEGEATRKAAILEAEIRDAIGKPTGLIYDTDLVGLTALSAPGLGISDLTGLEYCSDLVILGLANNQISDLSALSGLTSLVRLFL